MSYIYHNGKIVTLNNEYVTYTPVYAYPSILNTNTVGWYISSELGTITKDASDFVSSWNDFLSSGHNLLQTTGSYQPLWSTNGILFDGIDNYMQTLTFPYVQPEMIYMVIKQITWTVNEIIIDGSISGSGWIYQASTTPGIKAYAGTNSAQNNSLVLDTYSIVRLLFNGASSKLQVDSSTLTSGNFGSANMNGFTLGKRGNSGGTTAHIQVKEIILRNIADTTENETIIYNYLKNKYGL